MLRQLSKVTRLSPFSKPNGHFCRRRCLSLSSIEGPSYPPLVNSTLNEYFVRNVLAKYPHRPALYCREELPGSNGGTRSQNLSTSSHLAWDFSELDTNVTAATRGLLRMGVQKGDKVGVIIPNISAFPLLQWACTRIGVF